MFLLSCGTNIEHQDEKPQEKEIISEKETKISADTIVTKPTKIAPKKKKISNTKKDFLSLENHLIEFGLVDIQKVEPQLIINLKYSTPDNFVGIDLYGDLEKVYLQPDVAKKLATAQKFLREEDSSLNLLVFDGVRPLHIQQLMWDTLKLPFHEKTKFLSNPKNRSIHNYGAAVDLSIITQNGEELDMGTPYDFIGKLAYPRKEQEMLKNGKLSQKQLKNRQLLRKVMKKAGFSGITTEWWHFNSCSRKTAKLKYKLVL